MDVSGTCKRDEVIGNVHPSTVMQAIRSSPQVPPCRVSCIAIVTRSRPALLERILQELHEQRRRLEREYRVLVVDQTPPRHVHAVREVVKRCTNRFGSNTEYIGGSVTRRLEQLLAREGVASRRTLAFMLRGRPFLTETYGAALNVALLVSAGLPIALFDDDIVPEVRLPTNGRPQEIVFAADADPTCLRVQSDARQLESDLAPTHIDPIAAHEQLLGSSISYAVRAFGGREPNVDPYAMKLLRLSDGTGHVAITSLGIAGDCGLWSLHGYATRRGADLAHLTRSNARYKTLRHSRLVIRSAPLISVTGGGFLMNAAIALDNRVAMAPFMPAGRNMDGVFAHCFETCFDTSFIAFMPQIVLHQPPPRGGTVPFGDSLSPNAAVMRLSDIVIHILRTSPIACIRGECDDKLKAVGYHLKALALAGDSLRGALIRLWQEQILTRHLAFLESVLASESHAGQKAPLWRRDVTAQAEAVRRALRTEGHRDVLLSIPISAAELFRVIGLIGEAFLCWRSTWEAARRLRDSGSLEAVEETGHETTHTIG
jgi:hypothetical protein